MAEQQHIEQSPSHSAEDDENAELFSAVLSTLDKEHLPLLASAILQRLQPLYQTANAKPSVGEPLYGSYHVFFPLTFDDISLRLVVKIPINGTASKWDEMSASALTSEANTMRLLKRETTIPLPDVLDFSSTTQNTLRCPYIIMALISGVPLHDVWFGHRLNGASLGNHPFTPNSRPRKHRLGNDAAGQVLISNRWPSSL